MAAPARCAPTSCKICPVITFSPTSLAGATVRQRPTRGRRSRPAAARRPTLTRPSARCPAGLSLSSGRGAQRRHADLRYHSPRTFTIQAVDFNGCPGTISYTLAPVCPTVTASPGDARPRGTVGIAWAQNLTATAARTTPYTLGGAERHPARRAHAQQQHRRDQRHAHDQPTQRAPP